MTWQPIETAPKDGTDVLALHEGRTYQARWQDDAFWFSASAWKSLAPTHWMPLPPPPATGEAG